MILTEEQKQAIKKANNAVIEAQNTLAFMLKMIAGKEYKPTSFKLEGDVLTFNELKLEAKEEPKPEESK